MKIYLEALIYIGLALLHTVAEGFINVDMMGVCYFVMGMGMHAWLIGNSY